MSRIYPFALIIVSHFSSGVSKSLLSRLQLVQTAAARFLTVRGKFESSTLALASLHWLVFLNSLNGPTPSYLAELLVPYTPARFLCSSKQQVLVETESQGSSCHCSFSIQAMERSAHLN